MSRRNETRRARAMRATGFPARSEGGRRVKSAPVNSPSEQVTRGSHREQRHGPGYAAPKARNNPACASAAGPQYGLPIMALRLGIDTGGTYTDAVLYDPAKGVVAAAKSPTTRHNLIEGIEGAASQVLRGISPEDIGLVSVSTTLATNAIVEGVRAPVLLVMAGFQPAALKRGGLGDALAGDPVLFMDGGHRADGTQLADLDLSGLQDNDIEGVDAVAVVGKFAVRNPAHELAVRDAVQARFSLPVTCSHQLSAKLDGPKRAITTLFNARLIPHLDDLLSALSTFLGAAGVTAPVMVVQGDGSLLAADAARARPVDTVLSGPAASLIGADHLARLQGDLPDAVCVSDMGGTTTDIGFLLNGRPRLTETGAIVGGFRTHVRAVDMQTIGLGGDSEIGVHTGSLTIGPRRAEPLALAAVREPKVIDILRAQREDLKFDRPNARLMRRLRHDTGEQQLNKSEQFIWEAMADGVISVRDLERDYGTRAAVQSLVAKGLGIMVTFTPTDAAHVLGLQATGSREAAELGADLLRMPKELVGWNGCDNGAAFSELVIAQTELRLANVHIDAALAADSLPADSVGPGLRARLPQLLNETPPKTLLSAFPTFAASLIGVGAPATLYYGNAATMLQTDFMQLKHADVCNAIGAVAGGISRRTEKLITSPADGMYRVHLSAGAQDSGDLAQARALAETEARGEAQEAAQLAGAEEIVITTEWQDNIVANPLGKDTFLEARLIAEASGRPAF